MHSLAGGNGISSLGLVLYAGERLSQDEEIDKGQISTEVLA
jgi:hypothetical protein